MNQIKLSLGREPAPEEKAWLESVEATLNAECARMEHELTVWGFCFAPSPGAQEFVDLFADSQIAKLRGLH